MLEKMTLGADQLFDGADIHVALLDLGPRMGCVLYRDLSGSFYIGISLQLDPVGRLRACLDACERILSGRARALEVFPLSAKEGTGVGRDGPHREAGRRLAGRRGVPARQVRA